MIHPQELQMEIYGKILQIAKKQKSFCPQEKNVFCDIMHLKFTHPKVNNK